jgi:hypothetical protein
LETAKQCVTTDPPNSVALKMEEARRGRLTQQRRSKRKKDGDRLLLVNGREDEGEGFGVIRTEFVFSADLGSSSNYTSREKLENIRRVNLVDRSGKRFRMKLEAIRVSRKLRGARKTGVKVSEYGIGLVNVPEKEWH